jgi:hypothetical protein
VRSRSSSGARALLLTALLLALGGCEERRFAAALGRDTEDAWQGFLARYPRGAHTREARGRLEARRWREARAVDSIYAYRRYLADYPAGRFVREARRRLGELRLARARGSGDTAALRRLVDAVGDAELAAQARALVAAAELDAALARGDAAGLTAVLDEFPGAPGAPAARARLRAVELQAAGDDLAALERLIARHPGTAEGAAASARVERLEAARVRAAGEGAVAALSRFRARFPGSTLLAPLDDEVGRAELGCLEARLDAPGLEAWLGAHPAHPAAAAARARLKAIRGHAALAARVRPLLDAALPYRPAATLDELRDRALGGELEAARIAVAEIATVATPDGAALLVDLATGPQLVIAVEALDALMRLCPRGATPACGELFAGAHAARPGEPPGLRPALLRLATGDEAGALQALTADTFAGDRRGAGRVLPAVLVARLAQRRASPETARLLADQAVAAVEAHVAALERLFPVDLDREHLPDAMLAARTAAALARLVAPLAAVTDRAAGVRARVAARAALWEQRVRAAMPGFAPSSAEPLGPRLRAREPARAAALAALTALARREALARPALDLARAPRPLITRCPAVRAGSRGP